MPMKTMIEYDDCLMSEYDKVLMIDCDVALRIYDEDDEGGED